MNITIHQHDKICSICNDDIDIQRNPETGEVMWDQGHNAQPVNDGRCCSECNWRVVIPRRMADIACKPTE